MRTSLTVGRIAGIPLKIHINWFLTAVLVTWSLAGGYFPQEYPGWSSTTYWLVGVTTALLFFLSVLLHELGHSLVAIREGVAVNSITLFIFGGVAHIAHEPETPRSEFRIVAAGPAASLLLAGGFSLLAWLSWGGPEFSAAASYLGRINLVLAVFNLIPGFPLDGGRILRAFLWGASADYRRATRWATNVGLAIALGFIALGIGLMFLTNFIAGLWVAFIGWYLSTAAYQGYRHAMEDDDEEVDVPEYARPTRPLAHLRKGYAYAVIDTRRPRLPFTDGIPPRDGPYEGGD